MFACGLFNPLHVIRHIPEPSIRAESDSVTGLGVFFCFGLGFIYFLFGFLFFSNHKFSGPVCQQGAGILLFIL